MTLCLSLSYKIVLYLPALIIHIFLHFYSFSHRLLSGVAQHALNVKQAMHHTEITA